MSDLILSARNKGFLRGKNGESPDLIDLDEDERYQTLHPQDRTQYEYGMRDGYNSHQLEQKQQQK
ncbi:MAG TPA: hypothetical protein VHV10_02235 [Ktedonobacteraceae bacterium]|jgi:hypothetical protein|nr:hypothetical protein [Ktedonobacteraceae bacterium]